MSQSSYYIHREDNDVRSPQTSISVPRVVGTCFFLALGAVVYGLPWKSLHDSGKVSAVDMPATKLANHGWFARQLPRPLPRMPRTGASFVVPSIQKPGLESGLQLSSSRGAIAGARAVLNPQESGQFDKWENTFTYADVKFDCETIKPSQLQDMLKEGWLLLDVRPPEQVARAKVQGSLEVPVYILKEDYSPYGLYQEAAAWGLGGWWMGGRPMKENKDFASQVMEKVSKDTPGIIAACQSGLRARQAVKELYLAGFKGKLAVMDGGYDRAKPGELCGDDESCIVPNGAKLHLAGSGNVAGFLGWRAT